MIAYEANWMGTQRQDQPAVVAEQVNTILKHRHVKRVGIDASAVTSQLMFNFGGAIESIDADLWQIRRSKFPDELKLMRQAVRCTEAMYSRARQHHRNRDCRRSSFMGSCTPPPSKVPANR